MNYSYNKLFRIKSHVRKKNYIRLLYNISNIKDDRLNTGMMIFYKKFVKDLILHIFDQIFRIKLI